MPRLSVIFRSLTILALGLLTTIAATWVLAGFRAGDLKPTSPYPSPGPTWNERDIPDAIHGSVAQDCSAVSTRLVVTAPIQMFVCELDIGFEDSGAEEAHRKLVVSRTQRWDHSTPVWAHSLIEPHLRLPDPASAKAWPRFTVQAYGWPADCLFFSIEDDIFARAAPIVSGGLVLQEPKALPANPMTNPNGLATSLLDAPILPCLPIYRGLLANTALYSLPWLAFFLGLPALRRRLRTRRGHCPACRYDLRGLPPDAPCPECGRSTLKPISSSTPAPI